MAVRGKRPPPNIVGMICVMLGVTIILSLVLPTGFWWFMLGAGLIVLGVYWSRRC